MMCDRRPVASLAGLTIWHLVEKVDPSHLCCLAGFEIEAMSFNSRPGVLTAVQ